MTEAEKGQMKKWSDARAAIIAHVLGLFPAPDGLGLKLYSLEDIALAIEETLDAVEVIP
jgi:hypothetical protein